MGEKATIIAGAAGGAHVVDGPMTTGIVAEGSPSLLRSEIDSRVVQIRPMSTPVDQISRMMGGRPAASMKVEYYSVDTKPVKAKITAEAVDAGWAVNDAPVMTISTDNDSLFVASETILVPSVEVSDQKGCKSPLMLYVVQMSDGKQPQVVAVNAPAGEFPEITVGTEIVRMGRAASELDVQTAQFGALPVKDYNYCQIFKTKNTQQVSNF